MVPHGLEAMPETMSLVATIAQFFIVDLQHKNRQEKDWI
jgi:hypothetical protein